MCFHGNQHPWAIKHPFISLYSKYHSLNFICLPVMNSPVFPSLDDIYCTFWILCCSNFICFFFSVKQFIPIINRQLPNYHENELVLNTKKNKITFVYN